MSLWANTDGAASAPKWDVAPGHKNWTSALVTSAAGTITANSATANVNGSGTTFTTLQPQALLYSNSSVLLGRVKSVTNATQVILYTPAAANVAANGYYYSQDGILTGQVAYQNTTPDAFVTGLTEGVYAVSPGEIALREANGVNGGVSPGWVILKYGEGGITSLTVNTNVGVSSTFANNEQVLFSNGSTNAVANVTTNATGHPVSAAVSGSAGLFANVGVIVQAPLRQKHLFNYVITANANAVGFSNGDLINGGNGTINSVSNLTTNATGGITSTTTINPGLWGNAVTNAQVTVSVTNATGGATTGNTVPVVLAANLTVSTNTGKVVVAETLGGHAGRIRSETLVYMRSISGNTSTAPFANT